MPRDGAIIFRDVVGKLDVLNVQCDKCGRRGRYHLDRLIERYGIDAKLFDWSDEVTADCPRASARLERPVRRSVPRSVEGGVREATHRASFVALVVRCAVWDWPRFGRINL
jgi:hypothetical protein